MINEEEKNCKNSKYLGGWRKQSVPQSGGENVISTFLLEDNKYK